MDSALHGRLVDGLYIEALIMAEEARAYFDRNSEADQEGLSAVGRLSFTCESLKVTTRLMHVLAWLMAQKAWCRGELEAGDLRDPAFKLGEGAVTQPGDLTELPFSVRALIEASEELYDRVARMQALLLSGDVEMAMPNPARELMDRLERAF